MECPRETKRLAWDHDVADAKPSSISFPQEADHSSAKFVKILRGAAPLQSAPNIIHQEPNLDVPSSCARRPETTPYLLNPSAQNPNPFPKPTLHKERDPRPKPASKLGTRIQGLGVER